ncbi:MAG: HAD hydrolase-like protein [Clostridia bacterium]|nr:HAD hydrolase-like protein [Clostridia bacterium]
MKKYKYLLFDLDGALTYSHPGIYNCVRYALKKMGWCEPTEQQLRAMVGPSLYNGFKQNFSMTEQEAARAVNNYRERYSTVGLFENEPIAGAKELLKACKEAGYKTALATLKPKPFADQIAVEFGFMPYFDLAAVALMEECTKEWVVAELMKAFGAKSEECLMIGDRRQDVLGARENGVDTAALRCGYAFEGELEAVEPRYIFDDLFALKDFLVSEA